jgi:hypothetical protein
MVAMQSLSVDAASARQHDREIVSPSFESLKYQCRRND